MRTPSWETSAGALITLLNSGAPLQFADLYTITLLDGTIYRWSGHDYSFSHGGFTWDVGPLIVRDMVRWTTGSSVDDMNVTIADNNEHPTTINGKPLLAFIAAGGFVGARLQVERTYWATLGGPTAVGAFLIFGGAISPCSGSRDSCEMTVVSDFNRLNVMVPREVYQPQCRNTVFDSACTLDVPTYTVTGAATSNTSANRTTFNVSLGQASGYFSLGQLTMTSGANAGISRSVKMYVTGSVQTQAPWPFPVIVGDTYSMLPGCDGTQATCQTTFNNVTHFRGFPYIPLANTIT